MNCRRKGNEQEVLFVFLFLFAGTGSMINFGDMALESDKRRPLKLQDLVKIDLQTSR